MKQAIIYARFSPRPNADECTSCDFQIEKCGLFCQARGFDVVGTYRDEGISGKNIRDRPAFQEALVHVCRIKGVLVGYHLTRLSRGIMDAVHICETLQRHSADFAIVTQAFDTTTPSGRFMFYVMSAIGQLVREETVERTRAHLRRMHGLGLRTSGKIHYGYAVDIDEWMRRSEKGREQPERIVPIYSEQVVIKKILRWRNEGCTLKRICDMLTEAGDKPRKGRWFPSMVKRIVDREKMNEVR